MSNTGEKDWVEVAKSSDLSSDTPIEIMVEDTVMIVIRHAGEITAYQGLCPHQFARLVEGRVDGGYIHCPRHMAKFQLGDGVCGPGWVLPPLRRYPVRETDDAILVRIQALED